ncbi:hypothetical protein Pfo_031032 [Paulownia fortunei]|nr:hypothetical protein Pfo_031032 [Paulownia fortunei]
MGSFRTEVNSLVFLVLSLSLFHLECLVMGQVKGYPPSVNCATEECAPYQVIHSQKDFEIRIYKNSTWISSKLITHSKTYTDGVRVGFTDLFTYIGGYNRQKVAWNMTAPVLTDILPKSFFKVYFYVPEKFRNNLPTPYGDDIIQPVKLPRRKFAAVTRFSGYLNDATIAAELAALKKSLQGTPWQSSAASPDYSAADFNPPWQVEDRVSEVILWFDKN